jgi:hypothetical protein
MENDANKPETHHHGRAAFIPAGVLIGLGVGLLTGYAGSGVLIGLGLGFLATALMPPEWPDSTGASCPLELAGKNMILLLVGIFLIIVGVGIVLAPPAFWTYAIPVFLILLGLWFVFRGHKGHS